MTSGALFKEAFSVFGVVLALVIIAALAGGAISIVADFLYAIVALIFVKSAQYMMNRHNHENQRFGLVWTNWQRGVLWGLGFTVVTLPFFAGGYWIWETKVLDRHFDFDWDNYLQWSTSLAGEPIGWGATSSGVWVWAEKSAFNVGVRNRGQANNIVYVEGDIPFVPQRRGTITAVPSRGAKPSTSWRIELEDAQSRGQIIVRGPRHIKVRVEPKVPGNAVWPLYQGRNADPVKNLEVDRNLWWIPLWVATQFLLIALPEEYFYRGWLQTRLNEAFEKRAEEQGRTAWNWHGFTPAIVVTSALFGIGHLLVPIGGALIASRMSVFFPALLFGWLKQRTGTIVAPVVYHACSNLMVLFAAVHFI